MTTCTSIKCPVKEVCCRAISDNDNCQARFNYEYTCNDYTGFPDYVSIKIHEKEKKIE